MTFIKYPHLERLGGVEVQDILIGNVTAFYKIDGTNGSIWWDEDKGRMRFGSRNRELDLQNDNAGFMNALHQDEKLMGLFRGFPELRLYGEWLVPHSLKTYREDAWRRFYVFDVYNDEDGKFYPYERYQPILEEYGIEYIPPIAKMINPSVEQVISLLDKTGYLIEDGKGKGEGIVLKNYDFVNQHGRTTWAKIISNEFKEVHHKVMGAPIVLGTKFVEDEIVEEYVTEHFVLKEKAKIENNRGEWTNKCIPELLGRVFYELVKEETTNFIKKHKNPTINFKTLNQLTTLKVKKVIGL